MCGTMKHRVQPNTTTPTSSSVSQMYLSRLWRDEQKTVGTLSVSAIRNTKENIPLEEEEEKKWAAAVSGAGGEVEQRL